MTQKNTNQEIKNFVSKIRIACNSDNYLPLHLHEPCFENTNASKYVEQCINSGWVSSSGNWVLKLEEEICKLTSCKHAIAVTNATSGIRLSLHLLGVSRGDEVLIPSMTFVATANAVSHLGAIPHFIDIEEETLGIDPDKLLVYLKTSTSNVNGQLINKFTNRSIKALMPMHCFGMPAKVDKLQSICEEFNIPMIEDAAESLGSFRGGKHTGTFGKLGIFSFNGNKIITTGGGGVIITDNKEIAENAKHLSTTAKVQHPWEFIHDQVAWNDRMPNINAALGVAQLEKIQEILKFKNKLYMSYIKHLQSIKFMDLVKNPYNCKSNNWLITFKINIEDDSKARLVRDEILTISHKAKIFLRPIWRPLHTLPMYSNSPKSDLTNTNKLTYRLINLPSSPQLVC
ncbi:LegC family aminotransferase [Prochlorococcus marinus]|uniref:LegC family aminotransferase n=1 Tax=Prochlorococcus marinus TaxID=1219 RepID=UPI0039B07BB9